MTTLRNNLHPDAVERAARDGLAGFVVLVLAVALVTGACSSKPQVCSDLDQLQSSVQAVKDVNVESGSLSDLQTKVATVQSDFANVKQSADEAVGTEVSAMDASLQSLKQATDAAIASPDAASISAVVAAVGATQTAYNTLKAAVPDC